MTDSATPRLIYRESIPDSSLQPFVTRTYELQSISTGDETVTGVIIDTRDPLLGRLLPNADANLIFDLGRSAAWRTSARPRRSRGRGFVVGVVHEPVPVSFGPGVHLFGVAFAVGRPWPFLSVPAIELAGRIVSLTDLWGDEARPIESHLRSLASFEERATWAHRTLSHYTPDEPLGDSDLQEIIARVQATSGAVRVDALAAAAGLTRQRFARWFASRVGMGPKHFIRLSRVQALLSHVLDGPIDNWTDVAARFGYYDQAHMIGEFTWFTGMPPERFLRARASHLAAAAPRSSSRPDGRTRTLDR